MYLKDSGKSYWVVLEVLLFSSVLFSSKQGCLSCYEYAKRLLKCNCMNRIIAHTEPAAPVCHYIQYAGIVETKKDTTLLHTATATVSQFSLGSWWFLDDYLYNWKWIILARITITWNVHIVQCILGMYPVSKVVAEGHRTEPAVFYHKQGSVISHSQSDSLTVCECSWVFISSSPSCYP